MSETRNPVPGRWECPQCHFVLNKCVIYTGDGTVGINTSPAREVCPNDEATLEQAYEHPNDQVVVTGPCCGDPECLHCRGDGTRVIGWRYRG